MSSWQEAGAGQQALPYPYYIDLVTKRYFHAVDNKRLDDTLACFTDDAKLTIVTDAVVLKGRDIAIRGMFQAFFDDNESIWHGNFVHTADPDSNSICSQFTVLVRPRGGAEIRYENCNRFYLKGDRFHRVYIYMSGDNLLGGSGE